MKIQTVVLKIREYVKNITYYNKSVSKTLILDLRQFIIDYFRFDKKEEFALQLN